MVRTGLKGGVLVLFCFLLDVTDLLGQLLECVLVVLILDLELCMQISFGRESLGRVSKLTLLFLSCYSRLRHLLMIFWRIADLVEER